MPRFRVEFLPIKCHISIYNRYPKGFLQWKLQQKSPEGRGRPNLREELAAEVTEDWCKGNPGSVALPVSFNRKSWAYHVTKRPSFSLFFRSEATLSRSAGTHTQIFSPEHGVETIKPAIHFGGSKLHVTTPKKIEKQDLEISISKLVIKIAFLQYIFLGLSDLLYMWFCLEIEYPKKLMLENQSSY